MNTYKKGDILVCSTNELEGKKLRLLIGHKYKVTDTFEWNNISINGDRIIEVAQLETNAKIGWFSERAFIPLDVFREFQLRQILTK